MKELFTMWRNTRMIVLVAVIAAVYAAVLIPFKSIPLIPGFTEIRVAQIIPTVASLLFGPAAAWGIAIGNLIGDLFGTFGTGSLFGFVGNFFLGAIPYMLWGRLGPLSSTKEPSMRSGRQVVEFIVINAVSAVACAVIIAWGLELLGLFPFAVLGNIITLNNFLFPAIVGPVLMGLLYNRVKRWGLVWTDIMDQADIASGPTGGLGALLAVIGSFGGYIIGNILSIGVYKAVPFMAGFTPGVNDGLAGKAPVVGILAVFVGLLLVALVIGRARTDLVGQEAGHRAA